MGSVLSLRLIRRASGVYVVGDLVVFTVTFSCRSISAIVAVLWGFVVPALSNIIAFADDNACNASIAVSLVRVFSVMVFAPLLCGSFAALLVKLSEAFQA
jgi:hypothetical protein